MAPHSSTLVWETPWMKEPGRLHSMGSLRVGHDWATSLSLFTFTHWGRKWQPTPVFLPGESQGRGAWWAAIYGVTHSRMRLNRLSSSNILKIFKCKWKQLLLIEKLIDFKKKQSQLNVDEIQHIKSTYIYCCYDYKLNPCNSSLSQY